MSVPNAIFLGCMVGFITAGWILPALDKYLKRTKKSQIIITKEILK